ncbi:MAG: hypothetical protein IKT70_09845 [Clostridia bacterium]|nr:hypothetical protein [Clostridia bacterium]
MKQKENNTKGKLIPVILCAATALAVTCTSLPFFVYGAESQPEDLPRVSVDEVTVDGAEGASAAEYAEAADTAEENVTAEEIADDEIVEWTPRDFAVIVDTYPNEKNESVSLKASDKIGGIPVKDLIELDKIFIDAYEAAKERLGVAHVDETKTVTPEVQALFDEFNRKVEELDEKYENTSDEMIAELESLSDKLLSDLEPTGYWKTTKEERELLLQASREAMEAYDAAYEEKFGPRFGNIDFGDVEIPEWSDIDYPEWSGLSYFADAEDSSEETENYTLEEKINKLLEEREERINKYLEEQSDRINEFRKESEERLAKYREVMVKVNEKVEEAIKEAGLDYIDMSKNDTPETRRITEEYSAAVDVISAKYAVLREEIYKKAYNDINYDEATELEALNEKMLEEIEVLQAEHQDKLEAAGYWNATREEREMYCEVAYRVQREFSEELDEALGINRD